MDPNSFIAVCFSDLAGQVRGHGVPRAGVSDLFRRGLPWPADLAALTAFGDPVETPWSGIAGLRLQPDANTEVTINLGADVPTESFVLGSFRTSDQQYWAGCTRSFLRTVVETLKSEFGLDVSCNYEHQFSLQGDTPVRTSAMSLSALRRERRFASTLASALEHAGITLVRFGAAAGENQFTATTQAKFGVPAADSALIFRQLVHATAERFGQRCSFAPLATTTVNQGGLVLGIDLFDDGDQVTYDSAAPDGISATLGSFIGGIVRHMPALRALTQPSVMPSVIGAANGHGSPAADHNIRRRAAAIRINPSFHTGAAADRDYSFAFAAADGTACPYLQLGAILGAGLLGLRDALATPAARDAGTVTPEILFDSGLDQSGAPCNLSADLAALAEDDVFRGAFPSGLVDAYANVRQAELVTAGRLSAEELCAWSAEIY